ncbi:MAG: hypothetical protein WCO37_03880 [Bacteroidota bacterium]|jgi:hypothetical protein
MKKSILKMFAVASLVAVGVQNSEAQNQNNLGAACGCPPVNTRTLKDLSAAEFSTGGGVLDVNTNTVLTCQFNYLIKQKIYVPTGKTITIEPGTVILGRDLGAPGAGAASALIIERGGKIIAPGLEECPIVFTAAKDILTAAPDNAANNILGDLSTDGNNTNTSTGTTGGLWGGVAICGKATNNLLTSPSSPNNDAGLQIAGQPAGTGAVEGISNAEADSRTWFGGTDDNDNSGIMRYCSIRHAGDIISAGNELNSLTLASVGRGTTIDHIEIISAGDDGIEVFGGTVNLKYISMLWGDDDGLDWDLGWKGNVQFLFVLNRQNNNGANPLNNIVDNGIEADADDNVTNTTFRSHPKIYNGTFIGSNQTAVAADNTGDAGFNFKERTEGEVYNCIVANYNRGVVIDKVKTSRTGGPNNEAYHNWQAGFTGTSGSLIVKCNTFVNCSIPLAIEDNANYTNIITTGLDDTKFAADGNVVVLAGGTPGSGLAGFDYIYNMNFSTNTIVSNDKFDAVPSTPADVSTSCAVPLSDPFFNLAPYRGAFRPGQKSWLSEWAILNIINATTGVIPCPTDINLDGTTNNADFLQLLGEFNQACD